MTLASHRKNIAWKKNQVGKDNPNFSGGRYIDDKGYIRVLNSDHPFNNHGYVYEHRLVMEKFLGRYLFSWEVVHHINEVKMDNRTENFYLTTVSEHTAIHREGQKHSKERKDKMRKRIKQNNKPSPQFIKIGGEN